jgi:hypothetical protein
VRALWLDLVPGSHIHPAKCPAFALVLCDFHGLPTNTVPSSRVHRLPSSAASLRPELNIPRIWHSCLPETY